MAEVKTIKIDVDTKQAVNAMDNLAQATHDVSASFADVYGEIQPLTARMGEAEDRLYELASAGKTTTKEYQDLLKTVGNYRKVQIQTDMAVDAAATNMGQKLGGALGGVTAGFSLAQGAMGAFGVESEAVEKAMLQVQSAMAIQQGVQGIKESLPFLNDLKNTAIAAFKGMTVASRAFMTAGIGILIVGIGLLIENFDKIANVFTGEIERNARYTKSLNKSAKAIKDNAKELDKRADDLKRNQDFEYAMAEAQGATTAELRKMKVAQAEERIELEKDSVARAENIYWLAKQRYQKLVNLEADEELIKKAKENAVQARETLVKEKEDLQQARQDKKDIVNQNKVDDVKDKQDRIKAGQDAAKESYKTEQDRIKAEKDLIAKSNSDADKLELEQKQQLDAKLEEIANQNYLNSLSDQEKELLAVQDKYFELETLAKGNAESLNDIEIAKLNEQNDINLKYQDIAYKQDQEFKAKQKEADDKAAKEKIDTEKAVADAKIAIQQQGLDTALQGINLIKGLFEKSKGVQKAALIAESAIGIAKMIISNKASNSATTLKYAALPGGVALAASEIAFNNISTGIGIAANIAATGKALKALGGGSVSPPPSTGGGGGSAGGQAPSFNVVGNSGINQLAQLQQQPMQAYVVSGSVTTAQSLDRNRIENATL